MSSLSRRVCTHAVALIALSLPAAVAEAQSDADLKVVSATTLTMPKYKQYLDATVNLANVLAKDPGISDRMDDMSNKSIAEQVKTFDSEPQVRAAIAATGLSTREFVTLQYALLQVGMTYAMSKGNGMSQDEIAKKTGVTKANLEFFAKNEAEINRLAEEAKARSPKLPESDDDAEDEGYEDAGDEAAE
jgi:hypothetical protein